MNSLMISKIESICLIPELSCQRKCPTCYENRKIYGSNLTESSYEHLISKNLENLPSLTEMLIDYNGLESSTFIQSLRNLTSLPVTITTNVEGMLRLKELKNVKFHLSIHTHEDILIIKELLNEYSELICSFSVMIDDLKHLDISAFKEFPIYFLYDKFGFIYGVSNYLTTYLSTMDKIKSFKYGSIDNCMLTRVNDQQCPASTQINIYRDGSIRRCPYQPVEPADADYSHGCSLIRSIYGTDK